jgi:integrase
MQASDSSHARQSGHIGQEIQINEGSSDMSKRSGNGGSIIVRKRRDGSVAYLPRFETGRDANGNRQRSYGQTHSTRKAAQEELRELMVKVTKGEHVASAKLTVGDWINQWLQSLEARETMGNISTRTREGYGDWLNLHVIPRLGAIELQKLTKDHINRMYVELRRSGSRSSAAKKSGAPTGLSQKSLSHLHKALSQCLKAAVGDYKILRNPCDSAEAPTPKKARGKVRTVSMDAETGGKVQALNAKQQIAVLDAFRNSPHYALVALGLATGLRRGELLGLRWSDIDFGGAGRSPTLTVERVVEKTRTHGVRLLEATAKNDSSIRTIGLDADVCEILRAHRKEQKELALKLGASYPADCLVFPCVIKLKRGRQPAAGPVPRDVDFNRPWEPNTLSMAFGETAKAAGFKGFSLHGLRHTHATQLLIDGVPVHVVSKRLGHATPVITMTTYAHVIKSGEDQAVQAAGAMLRAALRKS